MKISSKFPLNHRKGFTLVEMMVIIGIMGILVSLSTFGYRGWEASVSQREAQSDLLLASTAMESAKNFGSGYPTSLPSSFEASDKVTVSWVWGDASKFCLRATSTRTQNINYYIMSGSNSTPTSGNCPSAPFPPDEPNPSAVANSSSSITVSWAAVPNTTSYTVQRWTGSSSRVTACTGTSTSCVISSLTASTSYNISVTANNSYGSSAEGTTSVTTQSNPVPAAPSPSVSSTTANSTVISWPAVSGATGYVVRYGTGSPTTVSSCVTSGCTLSGLASGTTYNISVVATNAAGSSTAGTTNVTTLTPPPAPTGTPSIATAGPTAYTTPYPYNRYIFTASGNSCASGSLQWKFIVQGSPGAPSAATWSDPSGWQSSNTEQLDVARNRLDNYRYIYVKARCLAANGLSTEHGSYATTSILSQG